MTVAPVLDGPPIHPQPHDRFSIPPKPSSRIHSTLTRRFSSNAATSGTLALAVANSVWRRSARQVHDNPLAMFDHVAPFRAAR